MKKTISLLILVQTFILPLIGQNKPFDKAYDRFGNSFEISTLNVRATKPIGGPFAVNTLPTNSCSAGYFTLWFPQGSICDTYTSAANTMCELFSNVSGLLTYSNSPLSVLGNTLKVNILCADYTGTLNAAAFGTAFYVFPIILIIQIQVLSRVRLKSS